MGKWRLCCKSYFTENDTKQLCYLHSFSQINNHTLSTCCVPCALWWALVTTLKEIDMNSYSLGGYIVAEGDTQMKIHHVLSDDGSQGKK
jgi:hypothetical protein